MSEPRYEFENQRPDEKIILVKKRHPWVLFKAGLIMILVFVLIVSSFLIWGWNSISVTVLIIGLIFLVLFLMGRFFVYNSDLFIITNHRLINIDQSGFFTRRVSEAELENIQNVTYVIKGPIRSLLNFGDIEIQTAGNAPGLVFRNVENPHFVQERIVELQKKSK